jgi:cation diffusion facilitator CzcD-associated flavoprotein CzcO
LDILVIAAPQVTSGYLADASLTEMSSSEPREGRELPAHVEVLIIGAGFSGLAAAIQLAKDHDDFLIIERGSEVGGTWRDNTYPGAVCDVPSQLYSFSFALNPNWSRTYSPQSEIQDYLRKVADSFAVLDRIRCGVNFEAAAWDETASVWRVTTSAGRLSATVLVGAAGALSEPKMPDIQGIELFEGPLFHSAAWNHDFDIRGKRIAVIGTGASSIQIVPEIAPRAARVDVYQRTAPWVLGRKDRAFSPRAKVAFRRVPGAQRIVRQRIFWSLEATVAMFTVAPRLGGPATKMALKNIYRGVKDPGLRSRVIPDFALGCKRVLMSNTWYPALSRDNVDLITDGIDRIGADSIVSGDGTHRVVDAIVVATGFTPTDQPIARQIVGSGDCSLAQHWERTGVQAYKGSVVAGFPNLFLIAGPNTGLGHSSMVLMIESQVAYLVKARKAMRSRGLAAIEINARAQARYNARLQKRMRRTVWSTGGCQSWYLDQHGRNVTLWPRSTIAFRASTARFDLANYRQLPASSQNHRDVRDAVLDEF